MQVPEEEWVSPGAREAGPCPCVVRKEESSRFCGGNSRWFLSGHIFSLN